MSNSIGFVPAKSIMSAYSEAGWFGTNYTVNIYRGCCHGCIYCDSRSECYGVEDFDTVRAKQDSLGILERELRSKRKGGIVMTGAMSDGYNPFEKTYELTRGALKLIERYGYGVHIHTKSPLILRDIDLLKSIGERASAAVNVTITTADDALCGQVERNVAPTSERFETLRTLASEGINCGVLLTPVLPFINDSEENIVSIVVRAAAAGCKWVYAGEAFGVTLRQNQRDHYYMWLDRLFPGLKAKYISEYGDKYMCIVPDNRDLWRAFTKACRTNGIRYSMRDIVRLCAGDEGDGQLSLF